MEDGGSILSFRKNPLKASTNTCLLSSLICVTGESYLTFIPNFARMVSTVRGFVVCGFSVFFPSKNPFAMTWILTYCDITVALWHHRKSGYI